MALSGIIGGHYRIVEELGSGAMGEVYKAVDTKLFDRVVAVKVLGERMSESDQGRDRFRREVEVVARLDHPNIVTILDWGEHLGREYFVMEYIDGLDLQHRMRAGIAWSAEQRLDLARQVCDALHLAHERGVVHRDIKPGNIMVSERDGELFPKLVDFGIVHVERSNLTAHESQPGTFSYMSPEQLRGETVDRRSDLFSLGIVLFELFSGTHPFRGSSHAVTISRILHDPPPAFERPGAEIPPGLAGLVLALLEKEPARRPGTAAEVAVSLRATLRRVRSGEVSTDPGARAGSRVDEVERLILEGRVEEARERLVAIVREHPGDARATSLLDRLVTAPTRAVPVRTEPVAEPEPSPAPAPPSAPQAAWPRPPRSKRGIVLGLGIAAVVVVVGAIATIVALHGRGSGVPAPPPVAIARGSAAIQVLPWGTIESIVDAATREEVRGVAGTETPAVVDLPAGSYRVVIRNAAFVDPAAIEFSVVAGKRTAVAGRLPGFTAEAALRELDAAAAAAPGSRP